MDPQKFTKKELQRDFYEQYELKEKIGEGGYGIVHRAIHKQTDVQRAVKMIKRNIFDSNNQKEILAEFTSLRKLEDPNIVRLIECYQNKEHIFLVQEYLSGWQLFDYVMNHEMTEEDARFLFKQVLSAISVIHYRQISHRDIKPENFVFEREGSLHLKLIDFGLSSGFSPMAEAKNPKQLLRMRTPVGTLKYAAPEIFDKSYTEKCDIWSAGKHPQNIMQA